MCHPGLRRRLERRKRAYGLLPSARMIIALIAMLTVRRPPSSTARRMDFFDIHPAKRARHSQTTACADMTHSPFRSAAIFDRTRKIRLPAYEIERKNRLAV